MKKLNLWNRKGALQGIVFFSILLLTNGLFAKNTLANNLQYAEIKSIQSKAFGTDREYYLYLPENYHSAGNRKYPVLYVLHGQWDMLSTVAVVDAISNDIPELIIIGVKSRGMELRPAEKSDGSVNLPGKQFQQFLVDELLPHIKQTYPVADFSILSGHSNSGRFVINALLDNADSFDVYFAFSPSLDDGYINHRIKVSPEKFIQSNKRIFLSLGNEGSHMQTPYKKLTSMFDNNLQSKNNLTKLIHQEFPSQSHQASKISALSFSLSRLFDGWIPSSEVQREGLTGFKRHYKEMSEEYSFEAQIPLLNMLQMTFVFMVSDKQEEHIKAQELIDFSLIKNPASIKDFIELIDQLNNYDFTEAGKRLTKHLCKRVEQTKVCG